MKRLPLLLLFCFSFLFCFAGGTIRIKVGGTTTLSPSISGTLSGVVTWYYDDGLLEKVAPHPSPYRTLTFKALERCTTGTVVRAYWDTFDYSGQTYPTSHSDSWTIYIDPVEPTNVSLGNDSKKTIELPLGETYKLTASLTPSYAEPNLTWDNNNSFTTVNKTGNLTASVYGKQVGTSTITVTTANGLSDYTIIKVVPKDLTSLYLGGISIDKGESGTINVTRYPYYADDVLKWESSSSNVTVDQTGRVYGNEVGTAIITATSMKNSSIKNSCTVTVKEHKLSIEVSPESGTIFYNSLVEMRSDREGVKIYYAFDGNTPTKNSPYVTTGSSFHMKHSSGKMLAMAMLDGYNNSDLIIRDYQVKLNIYGSYYSGLTNVGTKVGLKCLCPDAKIYYTTDGTYPTTESKLYTDSIVLDSTMTIKAIANADGFVPSDVFERKYEVKEVKLIVEPSNNVIEKGTAITLKAEPSDAVIYYSLDGSDPQNGILYTDSIKIDHAIHLRAIAVKENYRYATIDKIIYVEFAFAYNDNILKWKNTNYIPQLAYNVSISKGCEFSQITLKKDGDTEVEGEAFISANKLYYVPTQRLEYGSSYQLLIPDSAIKDHYGRNVETRTLSFCTFPNQTIKSLNYEYGEFGIEYINVKMNDNSVWRWDNWNSTPKKILLNTNNDKLNYEGWNGMNYLLKNDGSLWTWGENYYGEVGNGTTKRQTTPYNVMNDVDTIFVLKSSVFAKKRDNSLWCWGHNQKGQLGIGSTTTRLSPYKVLENVDTVIVNEETPCVAVLKIDGTLWMTGDNSKGALGNGTTTDVNKFTQVMSNVRRIYGWKEKYSSESMFAIKIDGSLWTWGENNGQVKSVMDYILEPQKIMENVSQLIYNTLGWSSNYFVIKTDNSLWAWGENKYGTLGVGNNTNVYEPTFVMNDVKNVEIGTSNTYAIKADKTLWGWGDGVSLGIDATKNSQYHSPVKLLDNVSMVVPSHQHDNITGAIVGDTDLFCWGQCSDMGIYWKTPQKILGYSSEIEQLGLETSQVKLKVGESKVLDLSIEPCDVVYKSLEWTSSCDSVVSVSKSGVLYAKSEGEAIITVSGDGSIQTTCKVVVGNEIGGTYVLKHDSIQEVFCCPYNLDFTEVKGLIAYVVTGYVNNNYPKRNCVELKRVYKVPAGTGILLSGDIGVYEVPIRDMENIEYANNLLIGTLSNIRLLNHTSSNKFGNLVIEENFFTSSYHYPVTEWTIPANSGFLQIPQADSDYRYYIPLNSNIEISLPQSLETGENYIIIPQTEANGWDTSFTIESSDPNVASISCNAIVPHGSGWVSITAMDNNSGITTTGETMIIDNSWSGTHHFYASVSPTSMASREYPTEFDVTIERKDYQYVITSFLFNDEYFKEYNNGGFSMELNTGNDIKQEETIIADKGSYENPYSVAEIIERAGQLNIGERVSGYFIKGKISSIRNAFSEKYGTAIFNISDDGEATKEFLIYAAYYLGNKGWTEGNSQIEIGDDVLIYGTITNYNGILETANKEAYIVSLNGNECIFPTIGKGTQDNPYTVADILSVAGDLGKDSYSIKKYYIKGKVSFVGNNYDQSGTAIFNISDGK